MSFWGTFPNCLHKIIDEEEYDRKKDEAIAAIGNEVKKNHWKDKCVNILINMKEEGLSQREIGKYSGYSESRVSELINSRPIGGTSPLFRASGFGLNYKEG